MIWEWPTHSAVVYLLKDATQVYFSTARRYDYTRARVEHVLRQVNGAPQLNTSTLDRGGNDPQRLIVTQLDSEAGYVISVTWYDFDELGTTEFEP